MTGVAAVLARWRGDRGLLALLVVVVAVTAGLAGAVPRLLAELTRASLADTVAAERVDRVGVQATTIRAFGTQSPARALERLADGGAELDADLGPELAAVLGDPLAVVDSVRYDLGPLPGDEADAIARKLTYRVQEGVEDDVTLVEGELPDGEVERVTLTLPGTNGEPVEATLPVHQFAATRETVTSMGLAIGDRRLATPDTQGPVTTRLLVDPTDPVIVELSGIVELTPPDEPLWFTDARLHRVSQFDTNSSTTQFAHGYVPLAAIGELPGGPVAQPAGLTWRWRLDEQAVLDADPATVAAEALVLRTRIPIELDVPRWQTSLDRVLGAEAERRAAAVEVLGLGAVAVVGVAAALLAAVASLLAVRRREQLALVRGRGASRGQLLGAAVLEAVLVVGLGAVVAWAVLLAALPRGGGAPVVLLVAALSVAVLVAGGLADVRRPLGLLLADRRRGRPPPRSRVVAEGLLVIVAVVAVTVLRQRGVEAGGTVDVLVVAAPAVLAAAVAVVVARLSRVPMRAVAAATRHQRTLVVPLGTARAARARGAVTVVVLLVLGTGVAGLAAAVQSTVAGGQARAATERVGADVRVDAPPLGTLDAAWTPPSPDDDVVALSRGTGTLTTDAGAQSVDVVLVDAAALPSLGEPGLPELAWDGAGPTPLLVSSRLRSAGAPDVGDDVGLLLGIDRVLARVTAVDPRVLGLDEELDGPFVVLARAPVAAVTGEEPPPTTRLVRTDDPDAVVASALAADVGAEALVRRDVLAELATAPLARGVRIGFAVAALAATVATLLALVLSLAASAPVRRREAAVLAAVGTPRRAVRGTLLAEVLPVVAVAAAAGVALALTIARLLGERLDLSPFTGTPTVTDLGQPPALVAAALVLGAVAAAAVAAVLTLGRVDPGTLLREGDQ